MAVLVLVKLGAEQNRIRQHVNQLVSGQQAQPGHRVATARRCYREAMKVRPREPADRSAAMAFLARHNHARVARLGKLLDRKSVV